MSLTISKGKVCKPDLISVEDQKLRDENCLKLGKKIKDITKLDDNTWKVLDMTVIFDKVYRTVKVENNKIHCDMRCSQFKWERNRHPNCKHVQAVMLLEKKKFKIEIPVEWEIIFLESHLKDESNKATKLFGEINEKQEEYDLKTSNILELQKELVRLRGGKLR